MYRLLCCMKTKESYNRLIKQFNLGYIEWENFVTDLDEVREKLVMTDYDYAVIDSRLYWAEDVTALLRKREVVIIDFNGDFEEVFLQLSSQIKEPEHEIVLESNTDDKIPVRRPFFQKGLSQEKEVHIKPIYTQMYTGLNKQLICIVNLSRRAGSTFLTLNLAKLFSKLKVMSSVIELPLDKPYIFDMIGLEEKLKGEAFTSFHHLIADNNPIKREVESIVDGISWIIQSPLLPRLDLTQNEWDYYKTMKLVYSSKKSNIAILDCGSNFNNEEIKSLVLNEADLILVVVDPMPVECMQNETALEELIELKKQHNNVEFIVNKWDRGIKREDLYSFLRNEPLANIPFIPPHLIYQSVYDYKIPFEKHEVEEILLKPLYEIAKKILPEELLKDYFKKAYTNKENTKKHFKLFGGRKNEKSEN